jgi:hypothetical protein
LVIVCIERRGVNMDVTETSRSPKKKHRIVLLWLDEIAV